MSLGPTTRMFLRCAILLPAIATLTRFHRRTLVFDEIRRDALDRTELRCVFGDVDLRCFSVHFSLYASLKRLPNAARVVDTQLARFGLAADQNKMANGLTSISKRKLTVALATIGSPPVIILDSPTQGTGWLFTKGHADC